VISDFSLRYHLIDSKVSKDDSLHGLGWTWDPEFEEEETFHEVRQRQI
jgi:hypothetical protein